MITEPMSKMEKQVEKIHKDSVVIDGMGGFGYSYEDILSGHINAINVTLIMQHCDGINYVFNEIKRYYRLMEMAPDRVMLVEEPLDILRAKQERKLGIIFGMQNASPLGDNVTLLSIFHKLGIRIIIVPSANPHPEKDRPWRISWTRSTMWFNWSGSIM